MSTADDFRQWVALAAETVEVEVFSESNKMATASVGSLGGALNHLLNRLDPETQHTYGLVLKTSSGQWQTTAAWCGLETDEAFIEFADGSEARIVDVPSEDRRGTRPTLDEGLALLDPITVGEFRAIEGVLRLLADAVAEGNPTERDAQLIRAMYDLIRSEQMDTVPGETKRHRLVDVVGAAARYMVKELPKDGLAWWKFAELMHGINWHRVAEWVS